MDKSYSPASDVQVNGRGFVYQPTKPEHWIMGSGKATQRFGGGSLNPGGNWEEWLPNPDAQSKNGFEPMDCTIAGALNAYETLARFHGFKDFPRKCSRRFSAKMAGISTMGGNPHDSAESIRKSGVVSEEQWPFSSDINTWDEFYSAIPSMVIEIAKKSLDLFVFGHEYVFNGFALNKPALIKQALERGPVCVSVFGWRRGPDDIYFKEAGDQDQHWTEMSGSIVGYLENEYWNVLDTYPPFLKKVRWDTDFQTAEVYFLGRREPEAENKILVQIRDLCLKVIGLFQKQLQPVTVPSTHYPVPPIQPVKESLLPKPITMPEPTESKRERLYRVAKSCIGRDMSPNDVAPDSLACMESLDGVFLEAFGEHLLPPANRLSTANGYQAMLHDPRLEKITEADALPGDISIAPTGTSTNGSAHGHVGIRGKEDYMSNDSSSGLWKAHYTIAAWKLVFTGTLKFPLYYFRVKG